MYIIGVDGGGTKTKAVLFHTKLGTIWTTQVAATNPHSTSFKHSVMTVIHIIEQALFHGELTENTDLYVGLGIAGLGREIEREKWLTIFKENSTHLSSVRDITIESDGKIALYSSTYGKDGIVSISGTGALTFGIFRQERARVGGWGHLIGAEPGSGYHLGSQALQAIYEEEDGLGESTLLTKIILENEGVRTVHELIPIVYQEQGEKQRIASYARYVFQAMEQQDVIAKKIVEKTAESIAYHGLHLYHSLFENVSEQVPFVLAGGIIQNEYMVQLVRTALEGVPKLKVKVAENEPVIGSIVTILLNHGYSTSDIQQLLQQCEVGED